MDCECAIPMMIRLSEDNNYRSLALLSMAELDWDEFNKKKCYGNLF